MVRAPCCEKMGLKKGPWTPEEDHILITYIQQYGHGNWRALPKQAGLLRCGKSCRLRWINYLRPDIKRGNFTREEEDTIINLHQMLGNRWSAIAARLPGRTDNEIKNVWHTHLKKRLNQHNPSTVTTQSNARSGNTTGYRPVSPHESSSSDMSSSSVTTFDTNTNKDNNNSACMKIESSSSSENIGETIDDSFWSEVLSNDNFSESPVQLQIPSTAATEPVGLRSINSSSATMYDSHTNMDFWYNLFTRDGELPQIPDI